MPVKNIKSKSAYFWIPPNSTAAFKIEAIYNNGVTEDITEKLKSFKCEDHATESIGNFECNIFNVDESFTNKFVGGEQIKYYKDYAATATTLRFTGIVELPSKKDFMIQLRGRSLAEKLIDTKITLSSTNTETSEIIKEMITQSQTDFTVNNVNSSTSNMTVNWYQKPFWDCVEELTRYSGYEFYIDASGDTHYFLSGSRDNNKEAMVHGMNLYKVEEFTSDLQQIRNKIRVIGGIIDGVQATYTSLSSDSSYGVDSLIGLKEEIINDDSIIDYGQAQQTADFYLSNFNSPRLVGKASSIPLATIQPGERINISAPAAGLPPDKYITSGWMDELDYISGKFRTTVFLINEPRRVSDIIKKRIANENKKKSTQVNPFNLDFSYNFLYNEDSGSHSTTEITNGVLKTTVGNATGNWTSNPRVTTNNISKVYIKAIGQTLTAATYEVSADGGSSWQTIATETEVTLGDTIGSSLVIKVSLTAEATQIDSLSLLYSTE